jgi:lipopolysaccharide/colanic/teichoic acid biosynthesis glycosyltransferase
MQRLLALILIIVLLPLLIFLSILVRINLGTPIFFKQNRPGKNGDIFTMVKYRTMLDGVDSLGVLLPDEKRLTKFGQFLRASSLDELPELYNIIKGDMAFVGPRPLLVEYLPLYSNAQARRHETLPGITGYAQINGRNAISWEKRLDMDVWYVDHRSIWLDIKILFLTIFKVFKHDDISHEGHATMPYFSGVKSDKKDDGL